MQLYSFADYEWIQYTQTTFGTPHLIRLEDGQDGWRLSHSHQQLSLACGYSWNARPRYAYAISEQGVLNVIDWNDPSNPQALSQCHRFSNPQEVAKVFNPFFAGTQFVHAQSVQLWTHVFAGQFCFGLWLSRCQADGYWDLCRERLGSFAIKMTTSHVWSQLSSSFSFSSVSTKTNTFV